MQESVLSIRHVGPSAGTHALGLGNKCFILPNYVLGSELNVFAKTSKHPTAKAKCMEGEH